MGRDTPLTPLVLPDAEDPGPLPDVARWRVPLIVRVIPLTLMITLAYGLATPVLPITKARWFSANCTAAGGLPVANCTLDFKRASAFGGIYDSAKGVVAFLCSASLGRFSDVVGRKPVLMLQVRRVASGEWRVASGRWQRGRRKAGGRQAKGRRKAGGRQGVG